MASWNPFRRLFACYDDVDGEEKEKEGKMTAGSLADRAVSSSKPKFLKLPKFFKKNNVQNNDIKCKEIPLTFKQNLNEKRFLVAAKQLINREERLFSVKQDGVGSNKSRVEEEEDDEERLRKDSEDLFKAVWYTVENTFEVQTEKEKEALKQAVLVLQQEDEQDRRWQGVGEKERPLWRPRCCRKTHGSLLQNMVERRMDEAMPDSSVGIQSSIQKEIIGKGKRLKEDLLHVAKHVRCCYPEDNVCQLYATLYHQAFSTKLREIADFGLSDEDCEHVLQWVNIHYPSILENNEFTGFITYKELERLLPENTLTSLEEQVLIKKENEVQKWCQNILREEKKDPELRDGCYISNLAIDTIGCIHGALKSTQEILGSCSKPERITHTIKDFLINYQTFLENIIEENQANTDAVLKANLLCIRQFREHITKHQELFPAPIRTECMHLLITIREKIHSYFTKPIHSSLKVKYTKLGTREWLKNSENVCTELLDGLNEHILNFTKLDKTCLKELLSQLHKEVLAEYVRKTMKKKIKLTDEKKQEQAAKALRDNSQKIQALFSEAGSNLDDLREILPKLAEVLTLKDPQFIALEIVKLSRDYPDFSEAHACAWLYLKANLSTSDQKNIKKTFSEFREPDLLDGQDRDQDQEQDPLDSSRNFFSKVLLN
ncbi:tumor necrosis factor alpha-induced protein 2 isoform X1 [Astyanax mexicanus]|uniref:tumor necrosis factor alpha-induced protein 2 isoform X1 n=2 Tax=Astyanax mexicanus TaxID=7994 RepID=UPI0020CB4261|nr:tumor necrosis factor alpha-induced protein 2 isoform X1 [Astyanax mexicanus]